MIVTCNLCQLNLICNENIFFTDYANDLILVKCPSCGLVFDTMVNPQSGPESGAPSIGVDHFFESTAEEMFDLELKRIIRSLNLKGSREGNNTLLDFGCGAGKLMNRAHKKGFRVYGTEANQKAIAYIKKRYGFPVFPSIEAGQFVNEFFDVVTLNHVLEHVANPKAVLMECHRVLKKGGVIAINVPNLDYYNTFIYNLTRGVAKSGIIFKGHLFNFTACTLTQYLKLVGFSDCKVRIGLTGSVLLRKIDKKNKILRRQMANFLLLPLSVLHLAGKKMVLTIYAIKS